MDFDRNTIEGFSRRVQKNSDYLFKQYNDGEDVHIVTHFMISLLGLIIFPYEAMTRVKAFPSLEMKMLNTERGWPRFKMLRGTDFATLDELIKHLRDAISHYQIEFQPSNERKLENITIIFGWPKGRPDFKRSQINGAALKLFVDKFSNLIENLVG
jgi:HEPN family protein